MPIEEIARKNPEELKRLAAGHLPSGVDEEAFKARVVEAVQELFVSTDHAATVRCSATAG